MSNHPLHFTAEQCAVVAQARALLQSVNVTDAEFYLEGFVLTDEDAAEIDPDATPDSTFRALFECSFEDVVCSPLMDAYLAL